MSVELIAHRRLPFSRIRLAERIDALLSELRKLDWPLCVLLTDDVEIRTLNRRFRGKNRATDVLSFEPVSLGPAGPRGAPRFLGDVVVSLDTAATQAKAAGHALFTEVTILCAHGLLHLCGYDHERSAQEAARQLRRERAILRAIGVDRDPLTLRGAEAPAASPPRRARRTRTGERKR